MYKQADKSNESNSRAAANSVAHTKNGVEQDFCFMDNRPKRIAQNKVSEMLNNDSQVNQLKTFQDMDRSYSSQQQHPIQKKDKKTDPEKSVVVKAVQGTQLKIQGSNDVVQLRRRRRGRHIAQTYVVDISHPLANNGLPVQYYRDNVLGHPAQRTVIAAALTAFAQAFPATIGQGPPTRSGTSVN